MMRVFHPLRMERWVLSDINPLLWWLQPAAEAVAANRQTVAESQSLRQTERLVSEGINAALDLYRDLCDAASEAVFFGMYGNISAFEQAEQPEANGHAAGVEDPRTLPWVQEALLNIDTGAYAEAIARTAVLMQRKGVPIPLSRIEFKDNFIDRNTDVLPDVPWNEWRLIRARQDLIVKYEPELALKTLPILLSDLDDRARYVTLLERLVSDPELPQPLSEQIEMMGRIKKVLGVQNLPAAVSKVPTLSVKAAAPKTSAAPKRTAEPKRTAAPKQAATPRNADVPIRAERSGAAAVPGKPALRKKAVVRKKKSTTPTR
jgi:hypothetical protein